MKITPEIIEKVKNRLVKAYNPREIYLFGSHAWGTSTEDSDLDLLIVVEHSDLKRHQRTYTASDANDVTTLCYKIKRQGKVLYARA